MMATSQFMRSERKVRRQSHMSHVLGTKGRATRDSFLLGVTFGRFCSMVAKL